MEKLDSNGLSKLNADISTNLKIRLGVYAKQEQMYIREVIEMALESFLNEKEKQKN
ncbi:MULTISPECIES: hypothetical protein [Bacillus cereus group]|uniref:hypothetical protein n=1 Tax=Bacillus cereus group TaxID=86661 RepID=UPI0015CF0086|nr:hypothetical protein [Bacillus thuringiensis]MCQ6342564.1 hypothetical protein [Bacillus cereus]